jgi:hypothetical protein
MKHIVRLLLWIVILIFLYMLFLSIRQGIVDNADSLTVIEQINADSYF